ncbi:hypothetical protein BOFL111202_21580 [Bordetella flabilis]
MFLIARQLHAHRPSHGARQQGRIGAHVVGAIAAVASRGLVAQHAHAAFVQVDQARQVQAVHMRILRARPYGQPVIAKIRHGTGWSDGRMHLVGPHVGPAQGPRAHRQRRVHIAGLAQGPPCARYGAQGRGQSRAIAQVRQQGWLVPGQPQQARGAFGNLLALGDHADEVADGYGSDITGQGGGGAIVHGAQRRADECAAIAPGIRRAHDPAMQHALHAHIVDIDRRAGRLRGNVHARHIAADDPVGVRGFAGHLFIQQQFHMGVPDQIGIVDARHAIVQDGAVPYG